MLQHTSPKLYPLHYPLDALSPHISGETLCFIYQKIMPEYLANYTDGVQAWLKTQTNTTHNKSHALVDYLTFNDTLFYRYATELYNHSFWLHHLTPNEQHTVPNKVMTEQILKNFGSMEKFKVDFSRHASSLDAKWVWLVQKQKKLTIITTDKDSPIFLGYQPIAACNLWQHAYYLDYRDRKTDYINAYLEHLINWSVCQQTLTDTKIWTW